ncbi:hypothetical protein [Acinetobacter sp. YH12227]|uniref:hypothetical protein n=1 Tax=Acinetobacter sp. YH12227 TaxID=2601158 RepID=UPI0015D32F1A|nr:hypothetical protein [Acinetobacter sp. YH12227]
MQIDNGVKIYIDIFDSEHKYDEDDIEAWWRLPFQDVSDIKKLNGQLITLALSFNLFAK